MTTYKVKNEFTLTKLIKEIPDADWDKLAIQSSWNDIRDWFWNNKDQFFNMTHHGQNDTMVVYQRKGTWVSSLMKLSKISEL